jgi:L-ectoine synthase
MGLDPHLTARTIAGSKKEAAMFTSDVRDVIGTERDVAGDGWKSRRLILARDGLPYSVHETVIDPGVNLRFAYTSHRETVYCIEGEGSVRDVASRREWAIRPGSIYSVGIGDDHQVTTRTALKLLCVFDPPLAGREEAD